MKYLRDKNKSNNIFFYITSFLLIAIVALFWRDSFLYTTQKIAFTISIPFLKFGGYVSDNLAYLMIAFDEKAQLIKEKERMNREISGFKITELQNKLLKEENFELKNLLGRSFEVEEVLNSAKGGEIVKKTKLVSKLGYVLAGPATPPFDNIIVDIGTESGISKDDLAVSSEGYLIGRVVDSGSGFSKIKLFSSYGDKTEVFLGENKTMVEMVGLGSGNFFVSLPRDFSVKIGDPAWYPGGNSMTVATVKDFEYKEGETFKKVLLAYSFNVREIRFLGILKK